MTIEPHTRLVCAHTELPILPWVVAANAPWPWSELAGQYCKCDAHDVVAVDDSARIFFERKIG